MQEQKPENKWSTAAKLVGVCVVCIGIIYAIVTIASILTS